MPKQTITRGYFSTFEEIKEAVHKAYIQLHNEHYCKEHSPKTTIYLEKMMTFAAKLDLGLELFLDEDYANLFE